MFKFFHTESKTIVGAAAMVGVFSGLSRLMGFVRDRILAGTFGAGDTLDAYYAAFKIPDFMFGLLVVGSLSASFIPLFSKYYFHPFDRKKAWRFANNFLHLVLLFVGVASAILAIFAPFFSVLIAPGFSPEKQDLVVTFFRIMLLAQTTLACSMVFGSVLQSVKRFTLYALAPILYNVGIIIGAVWMVPWWGPVGLAWGVVLGAFLHAVVQIVGTYHIGYRHQWTCHLRDADTQEVARMTGPRMLGMAVQQIMFVFFTMIASSLPVGSVSIFQFAYNIEYFPVGIIGISYAVAAFPTFTELLEHKRTEAFVESFTQVVRQLLFLLVPMTVVFLVLRAQAVRLVVGAGAFDWESTVLTADTLAFFALTFLPQSLTFVLTRAFFGLHDTMTPMTAGIVSVVVGLVSAFWFTSIFGVVGLGMAFSLASIVQAALLWVPLRQQLGTLGESRLLPTLFKTTLAGLACAIVTQSLKPVAVQIFSLETFFGVLFQGCFAGGIGLLSYLLVSYLLRSEELFACAAGIRRKVLKTYKPQESVPLDSAPSV
jgi:putative peptidoglycan lipid II flippase